MRQLYKLSAMLILAPVLLSGGPIYGIILFNSRALGGATVSIACPGASPVNGSTLDDGSYRIAAPRQGRCTITVTSPAFPGPAHTDIVSLQDASLYNFVVVAGNGGYELRRR